jgi:SAM-dependent methyltransferase
MKYAQMTVDDPNPLKRALQRRRLADALATVKGPRAVPLRVLDLGAGDGELVRQMVRVTSVEPVVFEPAPQLMVEAREKLAGLDGVVFTDTLDSLPSGTFDFIFCLEVFEHLPHQETVETIAHIERLLRVDGHAVIGVPHELFLPALVKGIYRATRRFGDYDARPGNVLLAMMGRPSRERPVAEIAPGLPYHFYHLGFDYRVLERFLSRRLHLVRRWFSPFPFMRAMLNSEVYFLLSKRERPKAVKSRRARR